ncbi:MAG: ADP-ribosylglycohydrolase family protein [Desulfobacterales bacterium]|nr:ADP-ribosylglycohydrolase family protein [Desulfobacterales bacterium]
METKERIKGLIIGTAVGDSIGLPAEGISKRRNSLLFKGKWKHRFIFKYGMVSDDTEHTIFVCKSLLASSNSSESFAKKLSWHLRLWFLSLPPGIGFATLRACIKLLMGFSFKRSGVYSAGNGPAMRAAPIGAFFSNDQEKIDDFIRCSTIITHTDKRALIGAKAVAYISALIVRENLSKKPSKAKFIGLLSSCDSENEEWNNIIKLLSEAIDKDMSVAEFADIMNQGNGISGYIFHTVPIVLYAWYNHFGDFKKTLSSIFNCGGDTDTTGAIAGALAGAVTGTQGIPNDWIQDIIDWPISKNLIFKVAERLSEKISGNLRVSSFYYFWPFLILRNIFFIVIVFLHVIKRLIPPY